MPLVSLDWQVITAADPVSGTRLGTPDTNRNEETTLPHPVAKSTGR